MKLMTLKNTAALLIAMTMAISCNRKAAQDASASGPENLPTPQESVVGKNRDSTSSSGADASRMSRGKDSLSGEVTPPNAKDQ